jgi:hypothetical protein
MAGRLTKWQEGLLDRVMEQYEAAPEEPIGRLSGMSIEAMFSIERKGYIEIHRDETHDGEMAYKLQWFVVTEKARQWYARRERRRERAT